MRPWQGYAGAALALIALAHSFGASAQDDGEAASQSQLQTVQQDIAAGKARRAALRKKAEALAIEIARYQDASVAAAHIAQQYEADLGQLEGQLKALNERQAALQQSLAAHHAHEAALLAALQRIAIEPPAALAFSPGTPVDSLRGAMLIGALEPRLKAEAAALAGALGDLARLRADTDAKRAEIVEKETGLLSERAQLAALTREKQALEGSVRGAVASQQRQLAALSARAVNLKDLIDRVEKARAARAAQEAERQREAAEAAAEAAHARNTAATPGTAQESAGTAELVSASAPRPPGGRHRAFLPGSTPLIAPVTGRVIQRFGAADGFVTAKGLTITTQPGAEVVSPFDGQVLFAGPFKGYGQILIIDHGEGYASLLARVDHIDAVVGQWVVAGEPVATMGSGGSPNLYMEFRYKDQPINPLPLLGAR